MNKKTVWSFIFLMTAAYANVFAQDDTAKKFSAEQAREIERIASDYFVAHPEILVKAMQKLEQDQAKLHEKQVSESGEFYRRDESTPKIGDVSKRHYLVEFFDYNCGYCKVMEPVLKKLSKDEKISLQIVYVNIPIIGKNSAMSATVAQALYSLHPDKFAQLHGKLMRNEIDANDMDALKTQIENMGIKWDEIMHEMQSRRPQNKLQEDIKKSRELGITGTPYLIIDGKEYRGAITSEDDLRKLLGD